MTIKIKKLLSSFCFILMSAFSMAGFCHDTTHVHPLITREISSLIEKNDLLIKAYSDLYEVKLVQDTNIKAEQLTYWGTDYDEGIAVFRQSYIQKDQLNLYTHYNTVIDGVVQEDAPVTKVLDHFYHAATGEGLSLNGISIGSTPSADRAMAFFNKSIGWFNGYTEESRQHAYFIFGQSLHHVEDMSSPAHIHNDPHLTFEESEKDDYEGWYLPQQKLTYGSILSDFFSGAMSINAVNNPWLDIWGTTNPNSMVQYFYYATSYSGTLEFPYTTFIPLYSPVPFVAPVRISIQDAPPPSANPVGELAAMYPPCSATIVSHCLEWQEDSLDNLAHWVIRGVGDFQHQYSVGSDNDWWAIELEVNPGIVDSKNASFSGRFYIEQLALNNNENSPLGDMQTVPSQIRSVFTSPGSAMVPNSQSLMEIYARNLLKPAVEYGAGFTQYWYDIANTPPYLKQVRVIQAQNGSHPNNVIYNSGWVDNTNYVFDSHIRLETCILDAFDCGFGSVELEQVVSRRIDLAYGNNFIPDDFRHINAKQPIVLELKFNEPIKQITQLRLGRYQANGSCEVSNTCLDIFPTPVSYDNPPVNVVLSENDRVWQIIVSVDQFAQLNGKVPLTVSAIDKNNHRDGRGGTDGGMLDSTPDTPAKRNLFDVNRTSNPWNFYPWHDKTIPPSIHDDENDANIAYSYDPGADINHTLLFDTVTPTGSINVDLTSPTL